jgi:hypothetical protein
MSILTKIKSLIPLSFKTKVASILYSRLYSLRYNYYVHFDEKIKSQRANPLSIPILILNFNQLFYLRQLINFLIQRGFEKIVVIDNQSDYPPLLEYYKEMEGKITVEFMDKNYGHLVFFKSTDLQQKYGQGYYVVTDADIVPYAHCPADLMPRLIGLLDKYAGKITKAGPALDISNIPDYYKLKENVIKWEEQFWKDEVEPDVYSAAIDTTFALYLPKYPTDFKKIGYATAYRLAGKYTALHGGWYVNVDQPSDEYLHYSGFKCKFLENG